MSTTANVQEGLDQVATADDLEERVNGIHLACGTESPPTSLDAMPMDTTRLSDVTPKAVKWLWRGRIPLGKLVTFDGDPGVGKSTLLADLGARVTTGADMPDGTPGMDGSVVVLTAEDDADDTVRPRFEAAGADLARVFIFNIDGSLPSITEAADELIATLVYRQARLFIVVPFATFMGKMKARETASTNQAMFKIKDACSAAQCSGVLVRHMRKETKGGKAVYSGTDSIGIIGTARGGLVVGKDPEDPDLCVLAVAKANLAAKEDTKSLQYRVETRQGPVGPIGGIEWLGPVDYHADEITVAQSPNRAKARQAAEDWLSEYLADGPKLQTDVVAAAAKAGHSFSTLRRAKAAIGVESEKRFDKKWSWELKGTA